MAWLLDEAVAQALDISKLAQKLSVTCRLSLAASQRFERHG